ncbi:hypothetical protein K458DRAFT_394398 [Lentithecium fluviatile CBS 122367]|uniref:Hydrophobic surface binding protein A-domain-containing protein n=1 Tax=Lentithecium fluviatile CBS 122367 TaxID=1168545 RepID=A0A6G1IM84_9PLEO|nr:hypothetical protein K458DRAFT_394398 [Lentithecium fluviatile CBS 122367]
MHFSTFALALLPLAFAFPTETHQVSDIKRQDSNLSAQVLEQINELNSSVAKLTTAVNNFDGSLLGLLPQSLAVITAETKLDATILKTTAISKQSSNFTKSESQAILGALGGTIAPIQGSLTALKNKYPVFKKRLQAPIVLLDLKVLKAHTGDLIAALGEKFDEDTAGYLGLGQSVINQAFDDAIAVYQGN